MYKTVSLDVEVISAYDVDQMMDHEDRLRQCPQYNLTLDHSNILKVLRINQSDIEAPIRSFHIDTNLSTSSNEVPKSKTPIFLENDEVIKDTVDTLIL